MRRAFLEVVATPGGGGRRTTLSDNLRHLEKRPVSLSLYDASIAVYARMLQNLSHFLDKAQTYAAEQHVDLPTFPEASLGHGMANFTRQIQLASDAAKGGAARLAGVEPPSMPDTETTFPELKERIAKTL